METDGHVGLVHAHRDNAKRLYIDSLIDFTLFSERLSGLA